MAKKPLPPTDTQNFNKKGGKNVSHINKAAQKSWPSTTKYALFLGIIAFCTYANTLQNDYAYDDLAAIQHNLVVRKGITAIPEILTTPYHYGNFRARPDGTFIDDLYRPLSLVMFAIEFQFFGENPTAGHFVNILLYSGCVILFFLFLYHLFKKQRPALAFIAALLFALHPIHTEVVANIKSADELLCFFFGLLSLNLYMKYLETSKMSQLISGLVFYFLSLLSKETSITFLAVVPFVFFFYRNEDRKKITYISLFSLLPAFLYLALRFSVLISHRAYNPGDLPFLQNALAGAPSFGVRIATAIFVLGKYIKLLFIPYPLISDYTYNAIPFVNFSNLWVWLTLIIYLFLIFYSIILLFKKRNEALAFGILFYLITISLFSNIIFLLGSEMAERFLFFPSAGFCIAIAYIIEHLILKTSTTNISGIFKSRGALFVLIPLSLIYIGITIDRNNDWKDSLILFSEDNRKSPDNCRLYYFLADQQVITAENGAYDPMTKQKKYAEIIGNLQKSVAIYPNYAEAQTALADAFMVVVQADSAIIHGEIAVRLAPYDTKAINALANGFIAKKKYLEAMDLLKKAAALAPDNPTYPGNIGTCNMFIKQYDSAVYYFKKAVFIDPGNLRPMMFLAVAYNAEGQKDSSRKYEAVVRETQPGFSVDKIPLPQ